MNGIFKFKLHAFKNNLTTIFLYKTNKLTRRVRVCILYIANVMIRIFPHSILIFNILILFVYCILTTSWIIIPIYCTLHIIKLFSNPLTCVKITCIHTNIYFQSKWNKISTVFSHKTSSDIFKTNIQLHLQYIFIAQILQIIPTIIWIIIWYYFLNIILWYFNDNLCTHKS